MKFSSRFRLILIISLILITAFTVESILNYRNARYSLEGEIVTSSLPLLRENIYSEIRQDFIPALNISSLMANDAFLKNWVLSGERELTEINQFLIDIHRKYRYFSVFFVSAHTNTYYHYNGVLKQISPEDEHDIWFYMFVDSGKEYDLDVDIDEATMGNLTIFINYRVEDYSGKLLGVAGVGIEMENFARFLSQKQDEYNRRIYLSDRNGIVQAHSDPRLIEQINIYQQHGISSIADDIINAETGPINLSYVGEQGKVLVTSRYIPEIDWFLIVEQDEKTLLLAARQNLLRTLLFGFVTSAIIIILTALTINYFHKRLERIAVTDELTSAANRRELEAQYKKAVARYSRYKIPISIIIFDIDHFKEVNDTRGHNQGDNVLVEISRIVHESIRPDDLLARWGGDEFVILLSADIEEAVSLAERLQYSISTAGLGVTISGGLAAFSLGDTLPELIQMADKALYVSKQGGRNRITSYSRPETSGAV